MKYKFADLKNKSSLDLTGLPDFNNFVLSSEIYIAFWSRQLQKKMSSLDLTGLPTPKDVVFFWKSLPDAVEIMERD